MPIVMPVMSHSWKASVPIDPVATWPVITTSGVESMWALPMGVTMLVAPGPLVTIATPGRPVAMRVALGHVAGALLVADQDVADRRVDDRVVDGQDGAAGQAEDHLDAFHLEALDEALALR